MRFNILSLGLVATVFMSASVRAIPVGGAPDIDGGATSNVVGVLGIASNVGGILGGLTGGAGGGGDSGAAGDAAGIADQATGGIVKRGHHHHTVPDGALVIDDAPGEVGGAISHVGGILGGLTGGFNGGLGGSGSAGDAAGIADRATGGIVKRGRHHHTIGRSTRELRVDIVSDAVHNLENTAGTIVGDLTTRGVRDTAGKRKRSVVGEPDEEEADEEEPEEEEVDENEEETDEEEADELGDAAPAGRR
ncbi:unnamed protein product [Mucor circinelloides]